MGSILCSQMGPETTDASSSKVPQAHQEDSGLRALAPDSFLHEESSGLMSLVAAAPDKSGSSSSDDDDSSSSVGSSDSSAAGATDAAPAPPSPPDIAHVPPRGMVCAKMLARSS